MPDSPSQWQQPRRSGTPNCVPQQSPNPVNGDAWNMTANHTWLFSANGYTSSYPVYHPGTQSNEIRYSFARPFTPTFPGDGRSHPHAHTAASPGSGHVSQSSEMAPWPGNTEHDPQNDSDGSEYAPEEEEDEAGPLTPDSSILTSSARCDEDSKAAKSISKRNAVNAGARVALPSKKRAKLIKSEPKPKATKPTRAIRKKPQGIPVPKSYEALGDSPADKMMWKWKNAGKNWEQIRQEWHRLTGVMPGPSTLSVRFIKLNENMAQNGAATDSDLCRFRNESEAELMGQLWERVAEKMLAFNAGSEHNPKDLKKRYDALVRSGFEPVDREKERREKSEAASVSPHEAPSVTLPRHGPTASLRAAHFLNSGNPSTDLYNAVLPAHDVPTTPSYAREASFEHETGQREPAAGDQRAAFELLSDDTLLGTSPFKSKVVSKDPYRLVEYGSESDSDFGNNMG